MNKRHWAVRLSLVAVLILALSAIVRAQEETSSKPPDQQEQQKPDTTATPVANQAGDVQPPAAPTPAYPVDATPRVAGKAVPWLGTRGPLHYGPFSVASVELFEVYDQFYPSGGGAEEISQLELLRTNIVFDKVFWKTRLILQYTPELVTFNGHTSTTADGNNVINMGTTIDFTPRLSVTLKDAFGVAHTRQAFSDELLLSDRETGGVVQNYFLENSGTHLENTFNLILNYKMSPRLLLTVAPTYIYADTTNPQGEYKVNDSDDAVGLTYALSPRSNIGVLETVEYLIPVKPATTAGFFRTTALFYSEQISPTWWITGKLGAEAAKYPGFNGTNWSTAGGGTLLKKFSTGDLAIAYTRGSTITNFLANRQVENADVSYTMIFSHRFKWTNGVGYYREVGGDPRIIGKYGLTSMQYRLGAGFSLVGNYTRRAQSSSTPQLISGDRNTFLVGLRWEPAALAGY
jgi:hypothetical protein